mmetsp:Transcript_101723/g.283246  ORF Transcript_101723/g.283246 Transcript_101723/m.283246 type:complete len:221 (+) Transcript_101723:389-1051(+)
MMSAGTLIFSATSLWSGRAQPGALGEMRQTKVSGQPSPAAACPASIAAKLAPCENPMMPSTCPSSSSWSCIQSRTPSLLMYVTQFLSSNLHLSYWSFGSFFPKKVSKFSTASLEVHCSWPSNTRHSISLASNAVSIRLACLPQSTLEPPTPWRQSTRILRAAFSFLPLANAFLSSFACFSSLLALLSSPLILAFASLSCLFFASSASFLGSRHSPVVSHW